MHRICCVMLFALIVAGCGNSRTVEPSSNSSVDPSKREQPTTASSATDSRPIILAFGDSLTAGSGLPPGSGYPEMLQVELDNRGYPYHVVNAGIGGDTTSGGVARIKSGLDLHPKFVILELGGNDGLRGLPMDSMQSNLEELIVGF